MGRRKVQVAAKTVAGAECLAGGGEMGALIRSMNWSLTALGPEEGWSPALRMAMKLLLAGTCFDIILAAVLTRRCRICQGMFVVALGLLCFVDASAAAGANRSFLTSVEREWLDSHPAEICIAPEANYPPFSFMDSGTWRGLSADMIQLVEGKLGSKSPHVILMDVSMPGLDGVEATRIIHHDWPEIRVIGLSMFEEADKAQAMRDAGAVDYLAKSGPAEAMIDVIRINAHPPSKPRSAETPVLSEVEAMRRVLDRSGSFS